MYNSCEHFTSSLNKRIIYDLEPFEKISKSDIDAMKNTSYRGFHIKILDNKIKVIRENNSYELRNQRILEFFIFLSKNYKLPNIEFIIHTDDKPPVNDMPMFVQSKKINEKGILYPDFSFVRWDWPAFPEASVDNWEIFRKDIKSFHIPISNKINKCLFRGAPTNSYRNLFFEKSKNNLNFDIDISVGAASRTNYIPLKQHCKYKYLLNLPGNSSSGRFKYLFLMDSIIFDINNEYIEFWYHVLKNNYHYFQFEKNINSFDKINDKINELENNPIYYQKILNNSKDIEKYFTYDSVIQYWLTLFDNYHKKMCYEVKS